MGKISVRHCAVIWLFILTACSTPIEKEVVVEQVAPVGPPPIPEEVLVVQRQAISAMQSSRHEFAVTALRQVLKKYPQYSGLHTNLGIAHAELGHDQAAVQAFRDALRVGADNPVVHNYLGILNRRAGSFQQARQSYQRAISLDESYSLAHLNLGILCDIYLRDLDCALKHYRAYETLEASVDDQFKGWKIELERRIKRAGGTQ